MDLEGQSAGENGVGATSGQEAQLRQAEDQRAADTEPSATVSDPADLKENLFDDREIIEFEAETTIPRDEFVRAIRLRKYYTTNIGPNDTIQKLITAAQENDVESINSFTQAGYGLDCEDSSGATPLLTAVMYENYSVAKILHRAHINVLLPYFCQYRKYQLEIIHTNIFVRKLVDKKFSAVRIGKILAEIDCGIDAVVQFRNSIMTKAYLLSCANENVDLFVVFPDDMFDFDVQHIQVLISCGLKSRERKDDFMRRLLSNICDYQKSEAGRNFLKKLCCREIVDEDFLEALEELLKLAPKTCIKIILKYGFNLVAKERYGRDITRILFANFRRKIISLLGKIDIDRRYDEGNTPLHIAAKYHVAHNIQFLLDKGADPNAFNDDRDTPLGLALKSNGETSISYPEESIKRLLFGGANPMTVSKQFEDTFFSFDQSTITSVYGVEVSKLLIAQLAINEAVGLSVEQPIRMLMSFHSEELEGYLQECRRQLEDFKAHEICDTRDNGTCTLKLTILTILAGRPEKLARYISKEHLRLISQLMTTTRYQKTSNLFYEKLFKRRVKDIIAISSYRKKATQVICDFIGIHDSNHLVVQKIINYFAVKDLVIFKEK